MTIKYKNSPLTEVVCEFRFSNDTPWDATTAGLMYGEISEEYKNKEEFIIPGISGTGTQNSIKITPTASPQIRFIQEDKKTAIQVGTRTISASKLDNYTTWEDFIPEIKKAFLASRKVTEIKGIDRIGLRYINKIDMKGPSVDLDANFDFRPFLGKKLPQDIATFSMGCNFVFPDKKSACRVTINNVYTQDKPDHTSYFLDLDYFLLEPQSIKLEEVTDWLENAHLHINEIFEGCIRDVLKKTFD